MIMDAGRQKIMKNLLTIMLSGTETVGPMVYTDVMSNSKPVVIFDLDDTLCDTSALRDGIARDIEDVQARISTAAPLPRVAEAAAFLAAGMEVMIMTARCDRPATRAQVASFGLDGVTFAFRADGDNRTDWKVKADHVKAMLDAGREIVHAFDDKTSNVDMFLSFGIPATQV